MAVLRIWVQVLARVKHGMVEFLPPLELLAPWEHVPLWAPLSPLEMPHVDVGVNALLWAWVWELGERRVIVVGRAGFGWLRVENFRPVFGSPPFVGPQYGHRGQPLPGVGDH